MKRIIFILIAIMSVACGTTKKLTRTELQQQLAEKDSLLIEKDSLLRAYRAGHLSLEQQLESCRESLAVYDFFNKDDISIFSNKTLETNGKAKELSGKNLVKYETIKMIDEVQTKLNKVEETIIQVNEQRVEKQWSDAELNKAIVLVIKADLYAIGDALDVIDKRDLSFLSKEQLEYYRGLSKKFDEFYNKYL